MSVIGYLGLDLGGTGAKAGVFDRSGQLLALARRSYAPAVTPEGFAEIPIEELDAAARDVCAEAVGKSGAGIRALAVASQGQTFVSLDAQDRPLHPAIIWFDSRAAKEADRLREKVLSLNPQGLVPRIETVATAPKILWLRQDRPEVMARAARYLLLPDYVSYRLTGLAVTDPSIASSTALYADDAPDYCQEALAAAEIRREELAEIRPSGAAVARVRPEVAAEWGLDAESLLVSGCNDQYAGAIGAGNCQPGIVSETTGTCLALCTLAEKLPGNMPAGLIGVRFPLPRYECALAYVKTGGLLLEWFNRVLCADRSLAELDEMAASVLTGSAGLICLPHFEGMVSPTPNPATRGFFCGVSLAHGLPELYRSVLESLAFCLRENLELLAGLGLASDDVRCIGGGARSDLWLQIKADVTGLRIQRPAVAESATLGAAILAAVGAGDFESVEDAVGAFCRTGQAFQPNQANRGAYDQAYQRYRNLCELLYSGVSGFRDCTCPALTK